MENDLAPRIDGTLSWPFIHVAHGREVQRRIMIPVV